MKEEDIEKDRKERVGKAKKEIEALLRKYELDLVAEGMIGDTVRINVMLQFRDGKKYPNAKLAQEDGKVLKDLIEGEGDKI